MRIPDPVFVIVPAPPAALAKDPLYAPSNDWPKIRLEVEVLSVMFF